MKLLLRLYFHGLVVLFCIFIAVRRLNASSATGINLSEGVSSSDLLPPELLGTESIDGSKKPQIRGFTGSSNVSDRRIVLAYPMGGCIQMKLGSKGNYPMIQGNDLRDSVMSKLSIKVGEFFQQSNTLTGQEYGTSDLHATTTSARPVPLASKYLSTLQMEVTTVPRGIEDHELVKLADSLECVENAYLDSDKYAQPDPGSQVLDEAKIVYDGDPETPSATSFESPNTIPALTLNTGADSPMGRRLAPMGIDPENIIKAFEEGIPLCELEERLCSTKGATNLHGKSTERKPDFGFNGKPTDLQYGLQWSLQADEPMSTQIERVWPWWTGSVHPTIVAVIDSGCDLTHPELKNRLWKNPGEICDDGIDNDGNGYVDDCNGYDFASNDNNPMPGSSGHGTGAAGIIAAESNNARGITGVCWGCEIMCLRFIGNGQGKVSNQVQAIDYAVKNGAKISNNSYGGYGYSVLEFNAIKRAQLAGHLFITSAGNNNLDTDDPMNDHTPSVYDLPNIVAVGAISQRGDKARFSNFGKKSVDILAPGVGIRTVEKGGRFATVSGTSFAAPAAVGTVGLIWSAFPRLSFVEVKQALIDGCLSHFLDPAIKDFSLCGGRLNAHRALYVAALMETGKYPGHEMLALHGGLRPSAQMAADLIGIQALETSLFTGRLPTPPKPTQSPLDSFVQIFGSLVGGGAFRGSLHS